MKADRQTSRSILDGMHVRARLLRNGLERLLAAWERMSGSWLTYHARPKRAEDCEIASDAASSLPSLAVVMQGPVLKRDDFTFETMRLYRRLFPGARLVLSTWKSEDATTLDRFRAVGIDVVTNDPPATPGQQNFNYQLVSSWAGLEHAAQAGAEYAIKTRTDQRVYGVNIHAMLMNMLRAFPLQSAGRQRSRIIGASTGTFVFRLYGMTDMFLFGHIDDMLLYWSAPLSDARVPERKGPQSWRETSMDCICEVYLATEFLKAVGHEPQWTLEDSWRAFATHFAVVDGEDLDLAWPKYERFREYRRRSYTGQRIDRWLSFQEWLMMYTGQVFESSVPEHLLDVK